jgi:hypothetical protein
MKQKFMIIAGLALASSPTWAQGLTSGTSTASVQDAVEAASQSHNVLFENEDIRLLMVIIPPGESAPLHRHDLPSVLIIDSYTTTTEETVGGLRIMSESLPDGAQVPLIIVKEPEGAHAITNTETTPFHLYRLEFKKLAFRNVRRAVDQRRNQTQ